VTRIGAVRTDARLIVALVHARLTIPDFDRSPLLVFYEVTRACDLVCRHCRAAANRRGHPDELTTDESLALIDAVAAFPTPPMLVLTGGDPLKRRDLFGLIDHAVASGLTTSIAPSPTRLVTDRVLARFRRSGVASIAISVDAAEPLPHDRLRGVPGTWDRAVHILRRAHRIGLPTQVNTVVTAETLDDLDPLAEMLATLGIMRWAVFFLVPVGRGTRLGRLTPQQYERAFHTLHRLSQRMPFAIKTTEAPFYRRFLAERGERLGHGPHPAAGVNDGRGVMFVSHTGELCPSGFLPLSCGRFPDDDPVDAYQQHPHFQRLRDPDQLGGKCGRCGYRAACGGSRARAFAVTGDPCAAEPDCAYLPPDW